MKTAPLISAWLFTANRTTEAKINATHVTELLERDDVCLHEA